MYKSLFISSGFHLLIVLISIFTLPFIAKQPIDIPPLVSVELIQIADKTNIPYAPKAKKIIDKVKKDNEKLFSEQAPPKKIKKDKIKKVNIDNKKDQVSEISPKKTPTPENKIETVQKEKLDAIPMPDQKTEKVQIKEEKNQKPSEDIIDENTKKLVKKKKPIIEDKKVKQVSEFEKKELFDPNSIAALIDKSKENMAETNKKIDNISPS